MKDRKTSVIRRGLSVMGQLFVGTRRGPSGERVRQLKKLERMIGVRFNDLGLLEQALTHRSYSHVTSQTRNQSNERMEFLGDSVLGLAVSQFLYLRFPERSEGALSKMKSLLVSRKVLSSVARDAGLGEFLLLSGEESEMGGRDRSSILADSFEGVIGAIYLDQGFRAANKFVQRSLLGSIQEILKDEEHTNFKSLLQEYVQSRRLSHPVYRVRREEGPEHEKEFAVEVVVRGEVWGIGRGKNKKDAEQNAAREALERQQAREPGTRRRPDDERPREERGRERPEPTATRSRERPTRSRETPPVTSPKDRGEHGILASREKLRMSRRTEEEQRRRETPEPRERPRPVESSRPPPARGTGRREDREDAPEMPERRPAREPREVREGREGRTREARLGREAGEARRSDRRRKEGHPEPQAVPPFEGADALTTGTMGIAAPPPPGPETVPEIPPTASTPTFVESRPAPPGPARPPFETASVTGPSFGRRRRLRRPPGPGGAPTPETPRTAVAPAAPAPAEEPESPPSASSPGAAGMPDPAIVSTSSQVPAGAPEEDGAHIPRESVTVLANEEERTANPEAGVEAALAEPPDNQAARDAASFERRKRRHVRGLRRR
jgi:ribonuclease-3